MFLKILTRKELSLASKHVITYEIDKRIVPVAKEYLAGCKNVEIINQDFLKSDIDVIAFGTTPIKIVANIPYYITTPIIEKIIQLNKIHQVESATLTVQREFAERMVAKPGTKSYGSFSIFVNFYTEPGISLNIPKTAFLPQPDVGSAVIVLKIRQKPIVDILDEKAFFDTVRSSFGQRRKTLRNSLSQKFEFSAIDIALEKAGIDPKKRGETLRIEDFAKLSNELYQAKL